MLTKFLDCDLFHSIIKQTFTIWELTIKHMVLFYGKFYLYSSQFSNTWPNFWVSVWWIFNNVRKRRVLSYFITCYFQIGVSGVIIFYGFTLYNKVYIFVTLIESHNCCVGKFWIMAKWARKCYCNYPCDYGFSSAVILFIIMVTCISCRQSPVPPLLFQEQHKCN